VDPNRGFCCSLEKVACYGLFNSFTCCAPDEPCCPRASVGGPINDCCAKGQECVQDTCLCKKGKKACGGDGPCCDKLFEQCCETGGKTHCEPNVYYCCGKTSCPPDAACCPSGHCYNPASQRCCGTSGVCGLAEDCCILAPGGCCPAGTHCDGTRCTSNG
jgi:hypothetical protein